MSVSNMYVLIYQSVYKGHLFFTDTINKDNNALQHYCKKRMSLFINIFAKFKSKGISYYQEVTAAQVRVRCTIYNYLGYKKIPWYMSTIIYTDMYEISYKMQSKLFCYSWIRFSSNLSEKRGPNRLSFSQSYKKQFMQNATKLIDKSPQIIFNMKMAYQF